MGNVGYRHHLVGYVLGCDDSVLAALTLVISL